MQHDGWIPTACYQCKAECAILARVENGRVKEIRGNPRARGKACVKGMAGVSLQYSPDRLTQPLKRTGERGEGRFTPISWEQAIEEIGDAMADLRDRGQAHKLTASFFPHSITDPKWRFLNAYGGFINTALPHCDSAKIVAFIKTFGGVPNHHIPPAFYTVPKGGVMLLVGRHAFGGLDNAAVPQDILDARERGAKLVVVDPFFTQDASKADWWIPIRPSGDTALFLGMIHHILDKKLYDEDFVQHWVREGDLQRLKDYVKDKTPKAMSALCDVPASDIKKLAEMCAKAPSVGIDSFKGIMLGQALDFGHVWTIFLALTGNVDNPGGQPMPDVTPLAAVEPVPTPPDLAELGFHRTGPDRDVFGKYSFIMEPTWYQAQAIKNDSLKILINSEANPALTEMGQEAWRQAVTLKDNGRYKLELLVSYEIMHSETSRYADYVLPDTSYFERWELLYMPWWYNYGHGVVLRQPVVEAPGQCRHSNEVFIEWGKRLCPEYFAFANDIDYYDRQLAGVGLSVRALQDMGGVWSPGTMGFRKYKEAGGFGTPSKKVQLYWEDLEVAGQAWPRPDLAPEYTVDAETYPFVLISYRSIFHQGSGQWTHNNPQLRDPVSGLQENMALVNTNTAERLGLAEGDRVKLISRSGEVRTSVKLTERIRPDCIGLHHGFGSQMGRVAVLGAGVSDNLLIPDAGETLSWQDVIGGESHVSTRVQLVKG
ncbi:molybdopterin-containing oxidoreductase family protein [Desulfohalobium retbaense]|uniref:Nitrate reductase n=1 Tax=Desulfohalobium retbaense (strain ATCC 49708 / DSM 5692 / JCM 16813 / HR100) TaxID=485915 RepID=C8X189_DESRD|nr:molybdopterin-dependent oxidoreductase [Desulfohalobium retbaense]ACV68186.1 Nitrate reductase [Desulfohalobium retbaense DSM 5692]